MKRKLDPVRLWVIALLVVTLSTLAYGTVLLKQGVDQNNRYLGNFSAYMRCLVVTDKALYDQIGKAAYYDHCDRLLFRGTGQSPRTTTTSTTG